MTIGFLCDENMPGPIVEALAARGLDVVWVAALCPGISDHEVLALAERQRRTLITLDKDFGGLTPITFANRSAMDHNTHGRQL